jgi:tetratricopeptide (TPR) repeat protein
MDEDKLQVPLVEKNKGGDLFKSGEFEEASKCYSRALTAINALLQEMRFETEDQLMSYVADVQLPCLLNRSACLLKLNYGYDSVVMHCTDALKIAPGNVKALYRRGVACTALGDYELAGRDLSAAAKGEPSNEAIRQAWEDLKTRRQQYKHKLKRIAQASFARDDPPEPIPVRAWLEIVRGLTQLCRSRFH